MTPPPAPPPARLPHARLARRPAVSASVEQKLAAISAKGPEYEAIAKLSREIIEQVVWEVVPELAEAIIREHVEEQGRLSPRYPAAVAADAVYSDAAAISASSASVSAIGLPFMLLAARAFATSSGMSDRRSCRSGRGPGTSSARQSAATQATPSSIDGAGAPGQQRPRARGAGERGRCSGARAARARRVHAQHGGQQRRADRAVRRREHPAERRREPVHGAQAGVGQAEAAEQAGQRERLAIGGRRSGRRRARRRARAAARPPSARIPSRASASVSGLARTDRNGSMSCDSASRPLAASTAGGQAGEQIGIDDRRRAPA